MTITAIETPPGEPDVVDIHVDGALRVRLPSELFWSSGLRVGEPITPRRLAELERDAVHWAARQSALHLLAYRPRTRMELRRRLLRKSFSEDAVDACVEWLAERGWIDDEAFAEGYVRDRVRLKPRGPARLTQELRARGVEADTAREVIRDVLDQEEVSEIELAREAAKGWRAREGEPLRKSRARLYAFLGRRGFGGEALRAVLEERLGGTLDEPL